MSLQDDEWKQWRDPPGFSQHFVGHLSEDRNTVTASWAKSTDDSHWQHDFDMTFRRITNAA